MAYQLQSICQWKLKKSFIARTAAKFWNVFLDFSPAVHLFIPQEFQSKISLRKKYLHLSYFPAHMCSPLGKVLSFINWDCSWSESTSNWNDQEHISSMAINISPWTQITSNYKIAKLEGKACCFCTLLGSWKTISLSSSCVSSFPS